MASLSKSFCAGLVQLGPAVVTIVERWLTYTVTVPLHCWQDLAPYCHFT